MATNTEEKKWECWNKVYKSHQWEIQKWIELETVLEQKCRIICWIFREEIKADCKLSVHQLFSLRSWEKSGFLFDLLGLKVLKSEKQPIDTYEDV